MHRSRRRFGRIALNALTAVSLVLCISFSALWSRSLGRLDSLSLYVGTTVIGRTATRAIDTPPWEVEVPGGADLLQARRVRIYAGEGRVKLILWKEQRLAPIDTRMQFSSQRFIAGRPSPEDFASQQGVRIHLPGLYLLDERVRGATAPAQVLVCRIIWPTFLSALLPAWYLCKSLYNRRDANTAEAPFCPRCRYDLTGNASGVCPECGTPAAAKDARDAAAEAAAASPAAGGRKPDA